ncbi:MAG: nucleotidyltransferase domain-containing protein [Acidobacteria bacterium]|jgi:predicted nucleotidyltransferase|nr:nucleotidyltransferase domain-containing protein [Acidobacteriota bacterium]
MDLETVRAIVLKHMAGTGAAVYLFGSRANGRQSEISDVDVGVLPRAPLPKGLLADLREALSEANVLCEVDVVDLNDAPEAFRKRVVEEGILWIA